jgi:hypothetical protein
MNEFYTKRRERFLNEEPARQYREDLLFLIDHGLDFLKNRLNEPGIREDAWSSTNFNIAREKLYLLILDYSEGRSIDEIARDFPDILPWHEKGCLPHETYPVEPYYLDEKDGYAYIMQLLSLSKLLHHDGLVGKFAALLDVESVKKDNRGVDEFYETLLQQLGLPGVPTTKRLSFKAHWILLDAIKAEPEKRPKFMKDFLKKWYPSMKGCAWYGMHDKRPDRFKGYWCFEAGLVTYLWDIDDSSYRDMPFYPKDLVDWARAWRPEVIPSVPGGKPCPKAGRGATLAQPGSARNFEEGEIMPDFPGSSYGATFWQWVGPSDKK